jgi:catechol 2,3-dioxygenase
VGYDGRAIAREDVGASLMTQQEYGIPPEGFRLPVDTTLGPVRLQVSDLSRSLRYYEQLIGMRALARTTDTAWLGAHGDDRLLVELRARAGVRAVSPRSVVGLFHFAILLPDRAALGRFLAFLATAGVHVGTADHAVSESVYLTDPDGLGIEVYADRPRASWRHVGRQLYMTTRPLDVAGVIEAAGGAGWAGMPPGTVMGHVHLHVGDLDEAEAFYHSAVGFDKIVWDYPGALFMSAGGYHHHLGTNTWSSGPPAAADQARLLSWDIVLPEAAQAAAVAERLSAAGYGVSERDGAWMATDPWGAPLRLVGTPIRGGR